jgi:hypothetical protein
VRDRFFEQIPYRTCCTGTLSGLYYLQIADAMVLDCYLAASYRSQTHPVDKVAVALVMGFALLLVKDSAYSDHHSFRSFGQV